MFKIIKDILVTKDGKSLNRGDFDEEYKSYMVQRWLSMYSDLNVEILNASVNSLYKGLDDKQQFKLLSYILPSGPMKGKYIKGKQTPRSKKDISIDISEYFEESSRKIEDSLTLVLGDKIK